jgi:hypothetical protein
MFSIFGRRTATNASKNNTRNASKNNRLIGEKVADYIASHSHPDFENANKLLNKALEATIDYEKSKVQKSQGYGDTRRANASRVKHAAIEAAAGHFKAAVKAHMRKMGNTAATNQAGKNAAEEVKQIFKNKKNNSRNNTRNENTGRKAASEVKHIFNRNNSRRRNGNNVSITRSNTRPRYSGRPSNYF